MINLPDNFEMESAVAYLTVGGNTYGPESYTSITISESIGDTFNVGGFFPSTLTLVTNEDLMPESLFGTSTSWSVIGVTFIDANNQDVVRGRYWTSPSSVAKSGKNLTVTGIDDMGYRLYESMPSTYTIGDGKNALDVLTDICNNTTNLQFDEEAVRILATTFVYSLPSLIKSEIISEIATISGSVARMSPSGKLTFVRADTQNDFAFTESDIRPNGFVSLGDPVNICTLQTPNPTIDGEMIAYQPVLVRPSTTLNIMSDNIRTSSELETIGTNLGITHSNQLSVQGYTLDLMVGRIDIEVGDRFTFTVGDTVYNCIVCNNELTYNGTVTNKLSCGQLSTSYAQGSQSVAPGSISERLDTLTARVKVEEDAVRIYKNGEVVAEYGSDITIGFGDSYFQVRDYVTSKDLYMVSDNGFRRTDLAVAPDGMFSHSRYGEDVINSLYMDQDATYIEFKNTRISRSDMYDDGEGIYIKGRFGRTPVGVTASAGVSIVRNASYRIGNMVFLSLVVNITTAKNTGQPIFSFVDTTIKPSDTTDVHLIASASYPRLSYIGANSYTLVANGSVPTANWFIQTSFTI